MTAEATLLLPCLNEAATLGRVLEECRAVLDARWTVLVADNGSADGSAQVARAHGAEVVHVAERGYGAVLDAGIRAARTRWVAFADADATYDPRDVLRVHREAERSGADLVVGSRLRGAIEAGAMPALHRYLGTPALSFLIRRLYGLSISDCNSGLRCVRREAYLGWEVQSRGMEFASAMLVRAAQRGARVVELPVGLRFQPQRRSHLRPVRDGLRHLRVILGGVLPGAER